MSVTVNENTNTNFNILLMWFLPSLNIKEALPVVELAISNWKKKYKLNKLVVKVTNKLNNRALWRVTNHLKKML